MMIHQPDFVTLEAFEKAKVVTLAKKKPAMDTSVAGLEDPNTVPRCPVCGSTARFTSVTRARLHLRS